MRKVKSLIRAANRYQLDEDPDELQSLDEHDSRWVEAWKDAVKQITDLSMPVVRPLKLLGSTLPRPPIKK